MVALAPTMEWDTGAAQSDPLFEEGCTLPCLQNLHQGGTGPTAWFSLKLWYPSAGSPLR